MPTVALEGGASAVNVGGASGVGVGVGEAVGVGDAVGVAVGVGVMHRAHLPLELAVPLAASESWLLPSPTATRVIAVRTVRPATRAIELVRAAAIMRTIMLSILLRRPR